MPKIASLVLLVLMTGSAFAQSQDATTMVSSEPAAQPLAAPAPARAKPRAACRAELADQKLSGPALREAISACVVREHPELAQREQCRTRGFEQGLRSEGLRTFVRDCLKSKS